MATCDRRDDVAVLLLRGCSPDEALEIEQHIVGCDVCARHRRELGIVRSLLDVVDDAPPLDVAPSDLREDVVARMVASTRRRRDVGMALLGAAAALLLVIGATVVVRFVGGSEGEHDLELVAAGAAPDAWAIVTLHERIDGTIVDLEAGDLPVDQARYELRVVDPSASVLGAEPFTVDVDGWAQVLLATTRPMQEGDTIEVVRIDGGRQVAVLRCDDCIV